MRTLGALVLTLGLTLTACGGDDPGDGGAAGGGDRNAADVAFAQEMIQHHAQALVMVDMTAGRDLDPEVAALTEQIRAAQAPEIETMTDWLTEWGEEVPATMRDHANAHGDGAMGGGDMPGMTSEEDLDALDKASDAEFQEMWLTMMIAHHEGAVEMAQEQQDAGSYQPALDLAADIERSQTEEIATMEALLSN